MGRINRSVKLLDKHYGKSWPFDVKLKKLDMHDDYDCVLGQLYDGYGRADATFRKQDIDVTNGECYAFDSKWLESGAELTEKWRTRIKKLRKERKK
jgi:hypothetical protein